MSDDPARMSAEDKLKMIEVMVDKSCEVPDEGFADAEQHLRHYVMCMGRIRYLLRGVP